MCYYTLPLQQHITPRIANITVNYNKRNNGLGSKNTSNTSHLTHETQIWFLLFFWTLSALRPLLIHGYPQIKYYK